MPRRLGHLLRLTIAALLVVQLSSIGTASGQTRCPAMKNAADVLGVVDAEKRYAYIDKLLRKQQKLSRYWNVTWVALAAGGIGLYTLLPQIDDGDRDRQVSYYISAIKAGLAVVTWSVLPLKIPDIKNAGIAGKPVCERLAIAEGMLRLAAKRERRKRLGDLITGIAVNIGSFLYLYLDRDDIVGASMNGGLGIVPILAKIYSQPMGAVHALRAYKKGNVAALPAPTSWHVGAGALRGGGMLSVGGSF